MTSERRGERLGQERDQKEDVDLRDLRQVRAHTQVLNASTCPKHPHVEREMETLVVSGGRIFSWSVFYSVNICLARLSRLGPLADGQLDVQRP